MRTRLLAAALALAVCLFPAGWSAAATTAELEAKIKAMEQTLQQMKQQLQEVRSTQHQQAVEVAASQKLPSWVERMTLFGDVRFRFEHTNYDDTTLAGVPTSREGKDRFRIRLRFGARSQIHPDVELGMRMTLGADDDPTSTNHTMGGFFGEYTVWGVDQAYVKWMPAVVPQKGLTFSFGKVPNPFMVNKITWDSDVVPEGAFLNYTFNKSGAVQPFATVAFMTVNQTGEWSNNVYAPWAQAGLKGKTGPWRFQGSVGYTDWNKLGDPGELPAILHGTPTYTDASGQTRTTSFKVWDLYGKGSFAYSKKGSVGVWGQYVKNTGATGPYDGKDTAWGGGAFVTYEKVKFSVWYKNVEADATPGFIADSDSGYVNRKGWVADVEYRMFKYGLLKLSYYSTEPEDASIPGAFNKSQTFYVNTIFKF